VANTVAFANALLDFALQHNYTFLPPALQVTAHSDSTVGHPAALDEDALFAARFLPPLLALAAACALALHAHGPALHTCLLQAA
jgi:hypothetical protein